MNQFKLAQHVSHLPALDMANHMPGGQIVPGVVVEHEKFGQGKVLSMEGQGANAKAVVYFKGVGQKKLALRFAKLRLVG